MKRIINFKLIAIVILLSACNTSIYTEEVEIPSFLHYAFKSEEWSQKINTEQFELYPEMLMLEDTSFSVTRAFDATTNTYFSISFLSDSSRVINTDIYGLYPIADTNFTQPFSLSQKLPISRGSSSYMLPKGGFDDDNYNWIRKVEIVDYTQGGLRLFDLSGSYKMEMEVYDASGEPTGETRDVSGTYKLRLRALRK